MTADSKRAVLCESLLLKCSICKEKTFVKTSKCVSEENRHAEINMKTVQAGLLTGKEAVTQKCSVKKVFLEICKVHRKTPVPEVLF